MKINNLFKLTVVALVVLLVANCFLLYALTNKSSAKKPKVTFATVDLDAVFSQHKDRLASQQEIDKQALIYTQEIEELKKQSLERAQELEAERKNLLEMKDEAKKAETEKALIEEIKKLRQFELSVAEKARSYKDDISKQSSAAAAKILTEIYELVERKSEASEYVQVLNSKALDKNGVPVFLYNRDVVDFTSVLIEQVKE